MRMRREREAAAVAARAARGLRQSLGLRLTSGPEKKTQTHRRMKTETATQRAGEAAVLSKKTLSLGVFNVYPVVACCK